MRPRARVLLLYALLFAGGLAWGALQAEPRQSVARMLRGPLLFDAYVLAVALGVALVVGVAFAPRRPARFAGCSALVLWLAIGSVRLV